MFNHNLQKKIHWKSFSLSIFIYEIIQIVVCLLQFPIEKNIRVPRSNHQTKKRKQIQKECSPLDHGLNHSLQALHRPQNAIDLVELMDKWMNRHLFLILVCFSGMGIVLILQQFTLFLLLINYEINDI